METTTDLQARIQALAERAAREGRFADPVEPPPTPPRRNVPPPIVRATDPVTSHQGAALIEPKRASRKGQVLAVLRDAGGGWVAGPTLCSAQVGGMEGLRRLRELRDEGWPIEARVTDTGSVYRLV